MELRDYQKKFKSDFEAAIETVRTIIGVAPTGSGKTVLFSSIIADFQAQLRNVLVLAHRREIITQTSDKLKRYNVTHGVLQAGLEHLARPQARVQVASIQTLTARAVRSSRIELPPADLLVIDEAHHVVAETYQKIVKLYPNAIIFGLTATPCRGDGRELADRFPGVTAYVRSPAKGLWTAPDGQIEQDDVVMVEVVTNTFDRAWWRTYGATLAERFRHDSIHLRALPVELLDEGNR